MLVAMFFNFLALIKNTERIVFNGIFSLFNNFTAIEALPAFKINKMIKEGLHDH
jgi:hypothetical protein